MDIPSTSAPLAKKPKVEEKEESEGNNQKIQSTNYKTNNTTVEDIICKVVLFCSSVINTQPKAIEHILIPSLIEDSIYLSQGKVDLTKFRYLSDHQLSFLLTTFKNCTKIKIDHLISYGYIFKYLQNFKNLKKLTIHVNEHDTFTSANQRQLLSINSIKIITKNGPNWNNTVEEILDQCPLTTKISVVGGYFSQTSCIKTQGKYINSLSLTDVKILPQNKNALLSILRNCKSLARLKLISTQSFLTNITFNLVVRDFLSVFITPNSTIEHLSFTLNQSTDPTTDQSFSNLLNLSKLKKLTIFFSSQYESKKLTELMNILKHIPQVNITFREYYVVPSKSTFPTQYLTILKERSEKYRDYIKAFCKNTKIIMIENFEDKFNSK